jgi:hypothetical protein
MEEARIDTIDANHCRSCGASMSGRFCATCGEKVLIPGEHSLRHFLGDVFNGITFIDAKFFKTLKLMVVRPGAMSYQYVNGRRVPFVKPMSMFFIANLIYFMFPLYNSFYAPLESQLNYQVYSPLVKEMVVAKVKDQKTDYKTFATKYDQQSINMAKLMLFLLVIYFSIPLALVNYRKSLYYFDHLIVSLEFWSLYVLLWFVTFHWLVYLFVWLISLMGADVSLFMDAAMDWLMFVFILYLLFRIEREAYKASILTSMAKAAFLLACAGGAVFLYRASLFFVTLWTM